MPVQINEVIIRAVVDAPGDNHSAPPEANGSSNSHFSETELAEKILTIIKEKKER